MNLDSMVSDVLCKGPLYMIGGEHDRTCTRGWP